MKKLLYLLIFTSFNLSAQTDEELKYTWQSTKKNMACVHEGCGKSYFIKVPTKIVSFEHGSAEDMAIDMILNSFIPVATGLQYVNKSCNNYNFKKCLFKNTLTSNTSNNVAWRTIAEVKKSRLAMLVLTSNERAACEVIAMPCVTKFLKDNPKIRMAFEKRAKENKLREGERLKVEQEAKEKAQEEYRLKQNEKIRKHNEETARIEAEKKKVKEEDDARWEKYINSPLSTSESLIIGAWSFEGVDKRTTHSISEMTASITFNEEKKSFTLTINIDYWKSFMQVKYGVEVRVKKKNTLSSQKTNYNGTWIKGEDMIKLVYDKYTDVSGNGDKVIRDQMRRDIVNKMNIINIKTIKGGKMNVKWGDFKAKGKK